MKIGTKKEFELLLNRYPTLESVREEVENAFAVLLNCALRGGVIYICGNGGSASDSEHIVGELLKSFKIKRPLDKKLSEKLASYGADGETLASHLERGIRAVALTSHPALSTAYSNDNYPQAVFAQQLSVLGKSGDVLIAISTSGNSQNCVYAGIVAKSLGLSVVSMTGKAESRLSVLSDVSVRVPSIETYSTQEYHLPIYHTLCAMLEREIFE